MEKNPGLGQHGPFAGKFLANQGFTCIAVLCDKNNWYQSPEIEDVIVAIRSAANEPIAFTYGSSMGGYAAWALCADLEANHFIAASPQYSLHVDGEKRWREEAALLSSWRAPPSDVQGYVLYDRFHKLDSKQANLIAAMGEVRLVSYDGFGHTLLGTLRDRGVLSSDIQRFFEFRPRARNS